MIQITAYLRTEKDHAKWKALENKTQFLHDALTDYSTVLMGDVSKMNQVLPPVVVETPSFEEDEESVDFSVYDPYEGLILDTVAGRVFDTRTGEAEDADPEMIKELKKRGQVR